MSEQPAVTGAGWATPSNQARAAQERIDALDAQLRSEHEHRARAIREAIDEGAPMKELANYVGVARATIYRIVAGAP
jgi:hypothetical protein